MKASAGHTSYRTERAAHGAIDRRTIATPRTASLCGLLAAIALGSARAQAQCLTWSTQFAGNFGQPANALLSFDDGSGSALYAGTWGVKRWNGSTWSNLNGLSGSVGQDVFALGAYDDGSGPALYAGGDFDFPTQGIAQWNGTAWVAFAGGGLVGAGFSPWVDAMTIFNDGTGPALYVGGLFDAAFNGSTAVTSHGIIKWDGSTWSTLAGGISNSPGTYPRVVALAVFDDGTGPALYAGGLFSTIGGIPADGFARWNGSNWSSIPGSPPLGAVSLAVYNDGSGPALFVGGSFTTIGGTPAHGLAKWNGASWAAIPGNVMGAVAALTVFDDGGGPALYAAGATTGSYAGNVARWDGTSWSELGHGVDAVVYAMAVHDDGSGGGPDLYVGGEFTHAGDGILSQEIAEWYGCQGQVTSMCTGDGTFAPCPCHNSGLSGRGCQNSTGLGGARLTSTGTTIPDTFTLFSDYEPATALTIFFIGDQLTTAPVLFGDGIRCAGGHTLRLYAKAAVGGTAYAPQPGDPTISARSGSLGFPISPGSLRYLQAYYRDGLQNYCPPPAGSNFNVTNALRVMW